MNKFVAFVTALGLSVVSIAHAENSNSDAPNEYQHPWTFNIMGAYISPDGKRDASWASATYLAISKPYRGVLDYEIEGFGGPFQREAISGKDWHYGVGGNLIYNLLERDGPRPYLLGGAGMSYHDYLAGSSAGLYVNAGIGVRSKIFDTRAEFRAELRLMHDFSTSVTGHQMNDVRAMLGISFPLAKKEEPIVERVEVDRFIPVEVVRHEPIPPRLVLRGVSFELDSARLEPNAKIILDEISERLHAYPDVIVEIGGHTCTIGGEQHNQSLSEKRAESVRDYLISEGISADRLSVRGYGSSQPAYSNTTDEGRRLNRRVELRRLDRYGNHTTD